MSRRLIPKVLALAALAWSVPAAAEPQRVAAAGSAETRAWEAHIEGLVRAGGLVLRTMRDDTLLPERAHARYAQLYKGVPIVGGDLVVQVSGPDVVSVFGTLYEGIDLGAVPAFSADHALEIISRLSGQPLGNPPELVVLPQAAGGFVLVYTLPVFTEADRIVYSIDAHTGAVVEARSEIQTQSAVGHGRGVLGDDKKMSVRAAGGQFLGDDLLRPPLLETFDLQGNFDRVLFFLNGLVRLGDSDLVADSDNDWTDGPAVDAHTYAGYTYDYYFKRFGRRGLDGNNLRLRAVVHPVHIADYARYGPDVVNLFFANAFYAGNGTMVFGEGLPAGATLGGQNFKPFSAALDVVAHELTHGVTQFTSGLRSVGESGALNESFSDMMGTSAEFFFQAAGSGPLKADYQLGEDITTPGAVRSMDNPALYGHADHYSTRYLGPQDAGGIHRNCSISNQVYYLAIEGGTNRTSGLRVQGVGAANREQIEKVIYRGFTSMMPSAADFATARAVTVQSARDLYGAGSPAERAMIQAWTAVGVQWVAARRTLAWAAVAGLSCASLPADSSPKADDERGRLRVSIDGGFVPGTRTFSATRTFTEFAEQGTIESQYKEDPGPGFEAGLAWRFGRRLGVSAAVSFDRRDEGGTFAAALPHPLYFGTPRRVTGDFGGGSQRETAVHLDLAFLGGSERLQWSAFAGPSLIAVKAGLLQRVEYTQAYPFDTVTVTGTPLATTRGRAVGFNVGAGLDWHVARHVAIRTQVRFSRATVGLEPTADGRVDVDAGGVHLTGGIRFDF